MTQPVTWDQIIKAAQDQDKLIGAQGTRAESLTVWLNALIESAGGHIIEKNRDARGRSSSGSTSDAGVRAAEIMRDVADSGQVSPALLDRDEDAGATGFEGDDGGFMVNWPFVWTRANAAVEAGTLDQSVIDDFGWALWPRVDADTPAAPPLRRHQPRDRGVQRARRPRVRRRRVHHQRREPGLLLRANGNPAASAAGLRRPRGPEGVPAGRR